MKNIFLFLVVILVIAGCKKQTGADVAKTFFVEGYLHYSRGEKLPVVNKKITLSQKMMGYSVNSPYSITDSTGYFKITYVPDKNKKDGIYIHQAYDDYSCVFGDISIIKNLPKGQDISLGKIYMQ